MSLPAGSCRASVEAGPQIGRGHGPSLGQPGARERRECSREAAGQLLQCEARALAHLLAGGDQRGRSVL